MNRTAFTIAAIAATASTGLAVAATAAAGPNYFGNAQHTVNALQAQGYNVILNGAAVYPLSGCKVTGVEGLNSSNVNGAGARIDRTQFDTVYVDILCKGG
jgi:hypothetical protein